MALFNRNIIVSIMSFVPLIILFYLALSEAEFNFENFGFNLTHILIFFWVLKNPQILGYGFIFLAGIINDAVIGLPIGISSFTYLILSGFAAYVRYLTVQPSIIYDWIVFVPSLAVTNSVYFYTLNIFFDIQVNYLSLALNTAATLLLYPVIGILFNFLSNSIAEKNA